jgi:RHS repeat-associated protein
LDGLKAISAEISVMVSFGLESYFVANLIANHAITTTTGIAYFSDVNGDGLTDLVRHGEVWFNHLENGLPVFTKSSALTPVPLSRSSDIDPMVMPDYERIEEMNEKAFPLVDTIRRWTAPFGGTIEISGEVTLVKDNGDERASYETADGVRVSIEHDGTSLWSDQLTATDYEPHTPTGVDSVAVARGDDIYFRVQSVNDGRFDRVRWSPDITYISVPSLIDVNGLDVYRYDAAEDFVLAGREDIDVPMPITGTVRFEGVLHKEEATTDDLTLVVERSGSPILRRPLRWDETQQISLAEQIPEDINVKGPGPDGDSIRVYLRVDSPIDVSALRWDPAPKVVYTSAADPDIKVKDDRGNDLIVVSPPYDLDLYPASQLATPQQAWTVPVNGDLTVISDLNPRLGWGAGGVITLTIKRPGELVAKEPIHIHSGEVTQVEVPVDGSMGDRLYFDYSTRDPALVTKLEKRDVLVRYTAPGGTRITQTVPSDFHSPAPPAVTRNGLFGQPYRGWGYAGYNGNGQRASSPIDEDLLKVKRDTYLDGGEISDECKNADYLKESTKDGFSLGDYRGAPCSPADESAYAFSPIPVEGAWRGTDDGAWVQAGEISSSRLGADTVAMPERSELRALSEADLVVRPERLSVVTQDAFSGGIGPFEGSGSWGASSSGIDVLDMNGDRFPDIVGNGRIQYTEPDGSLRERSEEPQFPDERPPWIIRIRQSSNFAGNVSLGGTPAMFSGNDRSYVGMAGQSAPKQNNSGTQLPPLGFTIGVGAGTSDVVDDLYDVNGDGLPDRIHVENDTMLVSLNLGYGFAPPETWGKLPMNAGRSENGSLGLSISFNSGTYDYAGGVSRSKNKSTADAAMMDVNGDGLPDSVRQQGRFLRVIFNDGNGFDVLGPPRALRGAPCVDEDFTSLGTVAWRDVSLCEGNTTLSGGAYFTIPIPLFLCAFVCSVIINPGVNLSESIARQEATLRDVDGDGYLDYLTSTEDGRMFVARNLSGRANLLKTITRPLGASIELKYEREGNTYEQSQSRWVLSRVSVDDGHASDGVDRQVVSYRYEGGRYDRREREFLGYGTVIEDRTHGIQHYRTTRAYLNCNYYEKGLLDTELIEDWSKAAPEDPPPSRGKRFVLNDNDYLFRDVRTGAELQDPGSTSATVFAELKTVTRKFYEGGTAAPKETVISYTYDPFGNVERVDDAADVGTLDDTTTRIGYSDCLGTYVVGVPDDLSVAADGTEVRHRSAEVDCADGTVDVIKEFLDADTSADTGLMYFSNGNLRTVTGPPNLHGERYAVSYRYDPQVRTQISRIRDSFEYTSKATYDPKFGLPETTTDVNGNSTRFVYDEFGRLEDVFGPNQLPSGPPTVSFEYRPGAEVPWALTQHLDEAHPADPLETVVFVDGLKRVVQTKKDATIHVGPDADPRDVMVVAGRTTFDFRGRVVEQRYPVTESLGTPGTFNVRLDPVAPTVTEYDILDRVTETTLPDGTSTTFEYAFGSDRAGDTRFLTRVTDAEGVVKERYTDVRGLTTAIKEFHTPAAGPRQIIWTSYTHDALGQVVRIEDANKNLTTITYDALGRRRTVDNPDSGLTETIYDLASNPREVVTANLRDDETVIRLDYEFTRLMRITYPEFDENNVVYSYGMPGAPGNRAGRIVTVTDESGIVERSYGKLGETTLEQRSIASDTPPGEGGLEVYTTSYDYDTFGRLESLVYPDGERLTYEYDSGGLVHAVSGELRGLTTDYVSRLEYDKFGQRAFMEVGNGVLAAYEYEPLARRLKTLSATIRGDPFQHLSYEYDDVGNVTDIVNDVQARPASELGGPSEQHFVYDDLYRLTDASGSYSFAPDKHREYSLGMGYDGISNITSKNQRDAVVGPSGTEIIQKQTSYSWTYHYVDGRPHAPDRVGGRNLSYDSNGNQIGARGGPGQQRRRIVWDEENRIQGVFDGGQEVAFKYDASGQRVVKRGPFGETAYVNPYFAIRNREIGTKNIFVGTALVATRLTRQEPGQSTHDGSGRPDDETLFYHADHLGSSNFVTDRSGRLYAHFEYFPFGETWIEEVSAPLRVPYRFTSKELDRETGLYYFGSRYQDPRLGQFLSTDPVAFENQEILLETPGALAVYSYANNNPVRYVDPTGELPEEATTAEGVAEQPKQSIWQQLDFKIKAWLKIDDAAEVNFEKDELNVKIKQDPGSVTIDEEKNVKISLPFFSYSREKGLTTVTLSAGKHSVSIDSQARIKFGTGIGADLKMGDKPLADVGIGGSMTLTMKPEGDPYAPFAITFDANATGTVGTFGGATADIKAKLGGFFVRFGLMDASDAIQGKYERLDYQTSDPSGEIRE